MTSINAFVRKATVFLIQLAVIACTVDADVVVPSQLIQQKLTITATSGEPDTRTERAADGSVHWSPGDQISLFYGSGTNGGSCFTAQNTETAKTVNFTGTIGVITGGNNIAVEDTYFWAVYPYNATASCDGNSITTVLPSEQVATADTFADDLFPSMGRSQGLNMAFYNICGGLKFTVSEEGIKSVTLRSNAGEHLAGKITAGYDDNGLPVVTNIADGTDYVTLTAPVGETLEVGRAYYLVFVPTVFESGFTLTFSKGYSQAVMNRTAKTTIRRSVFGSMTNPDAGLEWEMLYVPIPDENFKAYMIQNFDTNGNGELDFDEAEAITVINVNTDNIESMDGIAYCTNLKRLSCCGTTRTWNSAEQKYIASGKLTNIDVRFNTLLTSLTCYYNQLTSIDVSNNNLLTELNCHSNQLTSLDVSANTALTYLYCSNNGLSSLDSKSNLALTYLRSDGNQLTALDVSANTNLAYLFCSGNKLSSLDLKSNNALIYLECASNQLTSLDVSKNSSLTSLYCERNKLSSLDVHSYAAFTHLGCSQNQLTDLDVSKFESLVILSCSGNLLTSLDVSSNPSLAFLDCSPMNDSYGDNLLATLRVADRQSIPNVTENRDDSYIPAATVITSVPTTATIAVPEAIDLGLSVKWASFNLGATKPEGYGFYYAWGETEMKAVYSKAMYKWGYGFESASLSKYNTISSYGTVDNKTTLELEDDAAYVNLGGSWRMPTLAEWTELQNNCTITRISNYKGSGVAGTLLTSNKVGYTDKSVFIPSTGSRFDTILTDVGSLGFYWSSSLDVDDPDRARCVDRCSFMLSRSRYCGCSIRPVME